MSLFRLFTHGGTLVLNKYLCVPTISYTQKKLDRDETETSENLTRPRPGTDRDIWWGGG